MTPKISIIIPVYNVEKYIHRCINSIINQTLKDIEIIIVDDKSPDTCPQICDEYGLKDKRIKVIHKAKNEGLGITRNKGIDVATGEYITFCDSDDWVDADFYKTMYFHAKSENFDAVYSEFNTKYYPNFHIILHPEKIFKNKNDIEDLMLDIIGPTPQYNSDVKFQVSVCKAIYKTELIRNYNLRFHSEKEVISEDEIFNLDFLSKAQLVKYIPLQGYYYCQNLNSLTHSYKSNLWNRYQFFFQYLIHNYKQKFSNESEFQLRMSRYVLFCIRVIIEQEITHKSSPTNIHNLLNKICNDQYINKILSSYPINKMPIRHLIFYKLIKYKKTRLLNILLKLRTISSNLYKSK